MLSPGAFLAIVLVGLMVWLVISLVDRTLPRQELQRQEREELMALRVLVDDLKETAWDHRELDSPLATILIDKIRAYERRGRELGG